jgi:hypothetical protein
MAMQMSVFDLSFLTRIPEPRILAMERGETSMTNLELELISGAIGCPPMTLFLA